MRRSRDVGIVELQSDRDFETTVERLRKLLESREIKLFAVVDHAEEARKVGLAMSPTQLFVFGNPIAGTPVMLAAPSAAIDLPLKIVVSQDQSGAVWVTYNSPLFLQRRHALPDDVVANIAAVEALARALVSEPQEKPES